MNHRFVALSGGVGGAKLALGLAKTLPAERLTIIANTGDDFVHMGLHIAPDLDTLMYTLAAVSNTETGWGRGAESWNFMSATAELGGETWFNLGDKDLATHIQRTRRLKNGETLSEVTSALSRALGIAHSIAPMSNDPVRTIVTTADGDLAFQHYFVRERCTPVITGVRFEGADRARPAPGFVKALDDPALSAVIICPSNPLLSIDPILALPGIRQTLTDLAAPVIAVSPIVKGMAIKGPAAKMMAELGMEASVVAVARHYRGLVDGLVIDRQDENSRAAVERLGMEVLVTNTIMETLDDRIELAKICLAFSGRIGTA